MNFSRYTIAPGTQINVHGLFLFCLQYTDFGWTAIFITAMTAIKMKETNYKMYSEAEYSFR